MQTNKDIINEDFSNEVVEDSTFNNLFTALYHKPVKQHYYYYYYHCSNETEFYINRGSKDYSFLNEANMYLGRFVKNCLLEIEDSDIYNEIEIDYNEILGLWRKAFSIGNVFESIKYAKLLIQEIEKSGFPFKERLLVENELKEKFLNIPYYLKALFQITITVSKHHLIDFTIQLSNILEDDKNLSLYIQEIHISEKSTVLDIKGKKIRYHSVKLILLPGVVNSVRNPVIDEILTIIANIVDSHEPTDLSFSPFSIKKGKNTYLGQGNSKYKEFLQLLNISDKVYTPFMTFIKPTCNN